MRNRFVIAKGNDLPEWLIDTPKDIRAGAVFDLVAAHKAAFSNLKANNITKFDIGFKSKNKGGTSITIPKTAISLNESKTKFKIFPSRVSNMIRACKDKALKCLNIASDCRLFSKFGKWFLSIPTKVTNKKTVIDNELCALDPGVKTFQTLYSGSACYKYQQDGDKIKTLVKKKDKYRSLQDKNQVTKSRYRRQLQRIGFDSKNRIDDLHYKTIKHITDRFSHVFLPSFETQSMSIKSKSKGMNRKMLGLQHFLFKTRFKEKAQERGVDLKIVNEDFTTKTCGGCGYIKNDMTMNDRVFDCPRCFVKIDRDVNGGRNILLKNAY